MKSKLTSFFLALVLLVSPFLFSGCGTSTTPTYKMDLEIWGVFDDSETFSKIIQSYRDANPQIRDIKYKKVSSDAAEYERELFDTIASGKGPDIFYVHNDWLMLHENKMAPLPDSDQTMATFKTNFVDVAADDFIDANKIYAMPLFCDTLALYYNKDLLNQAGITTPPKTWEELVRQIKMLTKIDQNGNIVQSAIALGRSKGDGSINRSSDILSLLMLQGGTMMFDKTNKMATFDRNTSTVANPGLSALDFYTKFAKGNSELYTWNSKMDYSIDSFRYGRTAMMLNYAYWVDRLHQSDPKLNFDVSTAPQLDLNNQVNFANYWGLAVTRSKDLTPVDPKVKLSYTNEDRIKEAWKFIKYATTKPAAPAGATADQLKNMFDPMASYLTLTKKPAARRDLIEQQKSNVILGVFANQGLTARSWPQPDPKAVEDIFVNMIDDVNSGRSSSQDALRTAASRVNALVKREF